MSGMLLPTVVLGVLALALVLIGYHRGQGEHIAGLKAGGDLLLQVLPLLVFAMIVAGMAPLLVPRQLLLKWVGAASGMRGILIGTVAGGLAPGGPYVSLPLVVVLLQAGASIGTVVAFLTGWSLWALSRLPMEVAIVGYKVTLIRLATTFFFPPIAGWLALTFFGGLK